MAKKKPASRLDDLAEEMDQEEALDAEEDVTPAAAPSAEALSAAIKADEAAREAEAASAVSTERSVEWYRVARRSVFVVDGAVHTLHEGAYVSSLTHDVGELLRQGAALDPSGPPAAPADKYGASLLDRQPEPREPSGLPVGDFGSTKG